METTKPIDKLCAIVTDEMSLKEAVHYNEAADRVEGFEDFGKGQRTPYVANYTSAFMVRGFSQSGSSCLATVLLVGPIPHVRLQSMLLDGIRELRKGRYGMLGGFICDQGYGNRAMLTRLGVTKEQPFFSGRGHQSVLPVGSSHLIKNIRNNWRHHGFALDGDEIPGHSGRSLAYDS